MSNISKIGNQSILCHKTTSPVGGTLKRVLDVALSATGLLLLIPLLMLCAVGVLLTSQGLIFYGHRRVGFDGQLFKCWKFRTMVPDAERRLRDWLRDNPEAQREWGETHKLRRDPRITWFGGFLRRTSLDELPQLINVFIGEMSIVGPRPVTSEECERYGAKLPLYLSCKPGITGLWQISGRSNTTYEQRVCLDVCYAENWTLLLDAKIMALTLPMVLGSEDAR